jgi:hypothetical protein
MSTTEPGLNFVSLRLTHDRALAAGVPFETTLTDPIGRGAHSMPGDLNAYYQALTSGDTDRAEAIEVSIRRKYVHVSFNHIRDHGMSSNLPEPDGIRRIISL